MCNPFSPEVWNCNITWLELILNERWDFSHDLHKPSSHVGHQDTAFTLSVLNWQGSHSFSDCVIACLSTMETIKLLSGKLFVHAAISFLITLQCDFFSDYLWHTHRITRSLELSRFLLYIEISNRFSHTHTRKFKHSWLKWRRRVRIIRIYSNVPFVWTLFRYQNIFRVYTHFVNLVSLLLFHLLSKVKVQKIISNVPFVDELWHWET
jgi:hypothetical protein